MSNSPDRDSAASSTGARATYLIGRLDRIVRRELDDLLEDSDLSIAQYTTLSVLAARPGLSNAQLARRSLVTPEGMRQALSGLSDQGLIVRKDHATNNRVREIHLTEKGLETLVEWQARADEAEERLLAPLSTTQRRQFLDALQTLTETPTS